MKSRNQAKKTKNANEIALFYVILLIVFSSKRYGQHQRKHTAKRKKNTNPKWYIRDHVYIMQRIKRQNVCVYVCVFFQWQRFPEWEHVLKKKDFQFLRGLCVRNSRCPTFTFPEQIITYQVETARSNKNILARLKLLCKSHISSNPEKCYHVLPIQVYSA